MELLLIFVKQAIEGEVKTRLATDIGNKNAVMIYQQLLTYTKLITKELSCNKIVFYGNKMPIKDIWQADNYQREIQEGQDLGQRMSAAFCKGFEKGAGKVIIIGSDCIEITTDMITDAFSHLDTNDCVLGPAKDGGYYLLGMKRLHPFLFQNKVWSTDTILQATLADCEENSLSYHLLPILNDIDTISDLQQSHKWEEWEKLLR